MKEKTYLRVAWGMITLLASMAFVVPARAESNWPRWRGPQGTGHSQESGLPVKWDPSAVAWRAPLKGSGHSSPVIWGERIFLTSALEDGRRRVVFCLDRNNGKLLWEQIAWTGEPEKIHKLNSWASSTCATDGEIVVAFFGRGGLHAYSVEGKHLWSRDLGPFENPWGVAACPVIVGDLVIQNCDADVNACISALDKKTGKTVWTTPRPEHRGWSSPILIDVDSHQELVINGHAGVTAYNPATGEELWFCKSFNGRGTPTVTPAQGVLCAVNGLKGDIYAVRPGGRGDVTKTHMAWHTPRGGGRDIPSPISVDHFLLVTNMKGTLTCYDSRTGEELWQERLTGDHTSTPIAASGLAYFQDEAGRTSVVKPGPEPNIVAVNELDGSEGELFRASLTPSDGQIFSRSDRVLYCIGQRATASGK